MTDAFKLAREQIQEIANASDGTVQIHGETTQPSGWGQFEISIRFDGLERVENGLRVRAREPFRVIVPPVFPFGSPVVATPHVRFSGFRHVQWRRHPCLYDSSSDWRPEEGMYGFIRRLDAWIRDAAMNNLDPNDAPLHPPVAYHTVNRLVVPRADTPLGCRLAMVWIGRTPRTEPPHGDHWLEGTRAGTPGALRADDSAAYRPSLRIPRNCQSPVE